MIDVDVALEATLITLTNQARKIKTAKEDDENIKIAKKKIKELFERWHQHECSLDSLGYL